MPKQVLSEVVAAIREAPQSADGLILYALVNTLDHERSGCLFKLNKLREVDAHARSLAYRLMGASKNAPNSP
jgi:hypothetical protein